MRCEISSALAKLVSSITRGHDGDRPEQVDREISDALATNPLPCGYPDPGRPVHGGMRGWPAPGSELLPVHRQPPRSLNRSDHHKGDVA